MYNTIFHTESLSKYSFLITGGAGFIGSNIVEYLVKHGAKKVRVLDNFSTGFKNNLTTFFSYPSFEFIEGDICDLDVCLNASEGMDFISHQAALGSVPRSIQYPLATHAANVTGFLNMLTAAKEQKTKRFVFASSSSVYGNSHILPKTEDKIGSPLSPYAVSKLTNELYAGVFALHYNIRFVGLRYFNVFGPRQSPQGAYAAAIPLFIDALSKNQSPFINGDGEQTRDFTFVENAVQANIKAFFAKENALNNIYNIAAGEKISVNKMFKTIQSQLGATAVPNYRKEREGDIRNSLADISAAKKYLYYNPAVSFEEGIKILLKHNLRRIYDM